MTTSSESPDLALQLEQVPRHLVLMGGYRVICGRGPIIPGGWLVTSPVPVGDRTADRYWKMGIFYFNREDSAVLVEKRFGLGYTLNFARPAAWVIVLLILMGPQVPILAHL